MLAVAVSKAVSKAVRTELELTLPPGSKLPFGRMVYIPSVFKLLKITLLRYVSPILLLEIEIRTLILDCWFSNVIGCRG